MSFITCPRKAIPLIPRHRLLHVHRADLQHVLHMAAEARGITIRLGCPVVAINQEGDNVAVVISSAERIEADVIVGADGKSMHDIHIASKPVQARLCYTCLCGRRSGFLRVMMS